MSVLFRHHGHGLKNSHGYIMMKVLTSQGATCVIAKVKKMHWTVAEIKKMLFIRTGYSNWKNALKNFRRHETSLCHRTAISCDNALSETSGNIFELINDKTPAQAFTPPADEKKMGTIWIFVYYAVYGSGRGRCRDFLVLKWGGGS